jgi:hypothetical protein
VKETQIPCGDDNKKSNRNDNLNRNYKQVLRCAQDDNVEADHNVEVRG